MRERQSQEAGANSQQLQVMGDVHLHQGVSEERAAAIAETTARAVLAEYSEEAFATAQRRIEEFDKRLIERLGAGNQLPVFRDPNFQLALRRAQLGAASSDRDSDFEMLAGLLADRAARGGSRRIRAGIDQAIQVVDSLDDEALEGLTVAMAVMQYNGAGPEVNQGLDALDRLFGQFMLGNLPTGDEWLDHLDTLGAVRFTGQLFTMASLTELYARRMPGYVTVGCTPEEATAFVQRAPAELGVGIQFVEHALKPGYVRLPFANSETMRRVYDGGPGLSPDRVDAVIRFAVDEVKLDTPDGGLYPRLTEEIDARPSLRIVHAWWQQIGTSFQVTSAGRVLARANAQRHDHLGMLPPLD